MISLEESIERLYQNNPTLTSLDFTDYYLGSDPGYPGPLEIELLANALKGNIH